MKEDFAIGDTVTTSWTTQAGKTRTIVGTVQHVSPTRVQIRYERTTVSGRSFAWRKSDRWARKIDVQRASVVGESSFSFAKALQLCLVDTKEQP